MNTDLFQDDEDKVLSFSSGVADIITSLMATVYRCVNHISLPTHTHTCTSYLLHVTDNK